MSMKIGDTFYISMQKKAVCEICNKVAELRPYGKNGANICYECGMKDFETTKKMMDKCAEEVKRVVLLDYSNQFNEEATVDKEDFLPFKTHSIYITLDDDRIYKLNEDFSKEEIKEIPMPSRENPYMVLHKHQFQFAKSFLLSKMNKQTAIIYNKIGFISDGELAAFMLNIN